MYIRDCDLHARMCMHRVFTHSLGFFACTLQKLLVCYLPTAIVIGNHHQYCIDLVLTLFICLKYCIPESPFERKQAQRCGPAHPVIPRGVHDRYYVTTHYNFLSSSSTNRRKTKKFVVVPHYSNKWERHLNLRRNSHQVVSSRR